MKIFCIFSEKKLYEFFVILFIKVLNKNRGMYIYDELYIFFKLMVFCYSLMFFYREHMTYQLMQLNYMIPFEKIKLTFLNFL